MAISTRAGFAMGLGLLGVAGLVSVTYGQQGDGSVRKAAGNGAAAAAPATFPKAVIATIDLESVLRGYEKAKFLVDQLKAEQIAKDGQLKTVYTEAQQIAKEMDTLQPGSKDFKEREAKLTEFKLKLQAGSETLKREQQAKYVEIMANSYKEAQDMTRRYASGKGITCVLKNNSEPTKATDPDSVMAMMSQPVMYSDASLDITRSVLYNLNKEYTEAGGQIVKTPVGEATTDDATKPASAERPATSRPAAPANNRPAAAPRGTK
jgi:Skp family chaperone for outer membrane proteins